MVRKGQNYGYFFSIATFIIILTIVISTATATIPTTGLVSKYSMNGDATDSWGNYDGTASGAIARDGYIGQGYGFDGVDDCITVTTPDYYLNQTNVTINVWVKINGTNSAGDSRIFDWDDTSTGKIGGLFVKAAGTALGADLMHIDGTDDGEASSTGATLVNSWVMLTFVFNNTQSDGHLRSTVDYYVNGTLFEWDDFDGNTTYPSRVLKTVANDAYIGCNDGNLRNWNGSMDELTVWNRRLSPSEVSQLYTDYKTGTDPFTSPTVLYIAWNGSDSNDGHSVDTPIKTFTKANSLLPGNYEDVKIMRNSVYYTGEDAYLEMNSGINIGTYGEGEKPRIYGGLRVNNTGNWTACGTNRWCINTPSNDDYMPWFNNFTIPGLRNWSISKLTAQGHFVVRDRNMTVYSTSNPATYYNWVYLARREPIFTLNNVDNVLIENMSGWGSANMMFRWAYHSENITLRYNDAKFIGGANFSTDKQQFSGNAFEIYGSGKNILIENNTAYEVIDAGYSIQYGDSSCYTTTNVTYRYNVCYHCGYGFEGFQGTACTTYNNVTIEQNSFIDNDAGIFKYMRQASGQTIHERGIRVGEMQNSDDWVIKNNLIVNAEEYVIGSGVDLIMENDFGTNTSFYADYNNYYRDVTSGYTSNLIRWGTTSGGSVSYTDLAAWQAASGKDSHSISEATEFTNEAIYDFRPVENSEVCTASDTGSYIGALPCSGAMNPEVVEDLYFRVYAYDNMTGELITLVDITNNHTQETQEGVNPYTIPLSDIVNQVNSSVELTITATADAYQNFSQTFTVNSTNYTYNIYMNPGTLTVTFDSLTQGVLKDSERVINFTNTSAIILYSGLATGMVNLLFNMESVTNHTQFYEFYYPDDAPIVLEFGILQSEDQLMWIQVLDYQGSPLRDTQVWLYGTVANSTGSSYKLIGKRYADHNGYTFFWLDANMQYKMNVLKDGYVTESRDIDYRLFSGSDNTYTTRSDPLIINMKGDFGSAILAGMLMTKPLYTYNLSNPTIEAQFYYPGAYAVKYTTSYRMAHDLPMITLQNPINGIYEFTLAHGQAKDYFVPDGDDITLYIYINNELWTTHTIKYETPTQHNVTPPEPEDLDIDIFAPLLFIALLVISIGMPYLLNMSGISKDVFKIGTIILAFISVRFAAVAVIVVLGTLARTLYTSIKE